LLPSLCEIVFTPCLLLVVRGGVASKYTNSAPCPEKKRPEFSLHNFNKIRHSFVIFGMNHPEDSFYRENRKFIPNIITSLRSDDVIVTSLETTLSRTASGKDTTILCL